MSAHRTIQTNRRDARSVARKTELSAVESLLIEATLGAEARATTRETLLAAIQRRTSERQRLYAEAAAHPFLAPMNAPRIRELSGEIERLWDALRRERATRRVELERAFNVVEEDGEDEERRLAREAAGSTDAA